MNSIQQTVAALEKELLQYRSQAQIDMIYLRAKIYADGDPIETGLQKCAILNFQLGVAAGEAVSQKYYLNIGEGARESERLCRELKARGLDVPSKHEKTEHNIGRLNERIAEMQGQLDRFKPKPTAAPQATPRPAAATSPKPRTPAIVPAVPAPQPPAPRVLSDAERTEELWRQYHAITSAKDRAIFYQNHEALWPKTRRNT